MMKTSPRHLLTTFVFSLFFVGATLAQPLISAEIITPGGSNVLSEDCDGPYQLVIYRAPGATDTIIITLNSTGVAVLGVDFNFPAGTFPVTLLPGQDSILIDITVVNDGTPENVPDGEGIILTLNYTDGTSSGLIELSENAISDNYFVTINMSGDTFQTCQFGIHPLNAAGAPVVIHGSEGFEWTTNSVTGSGWYYVQVGTDSCGAKDSIYIELLYGNIISDTLYVCDEGPGVTILTDVSGDPVSFQWIPADSTLSDTNSLTPIAKPAITTTYILEVVFAGCTSRDTVVVQVDSLPDDLHIDIAPLKPYYCAGEIVALFSPTFDSLAYPALEFAWRPNDGTFLSDLDLLNAALQLQDTTEYIRRNTNNACASEDSITINVVPSGVPLSVTDTTLCPGASFQVLVLSNQVTDPEWTPTDGLSCSMCLDPVVTVVGQPGTTQTYTFSGKILDCPVGANLNITIPPLKEIVISGPTSVCDDDVIQLDLGDTEGLSSFQWSVSGGATLSCLDCTAPAVTVTDPPVLLTVTAATNDPGYCGAIGSFSISEGRTEQFVAPTTFACDEETVQLGPVNPNYTNLDWSVQNGNIDLSCNDCPNPIVTLHEDGTVILRADYHFGDTCSVVIRFPISSFPEDEGNIIKIEPASDTVAQGSEVTVSLNINAAPPTNIVWTVNGVTVPGNGNMLTFNANEELNTVTATFTNSKGCEQVETIDIMTVPPSYMVPNAFTPNNDMLNDRFRILILGDIEITQFLVFNRWGQLVYEGPANDLEGWDGQFKGEPASSDTYVYTATLRFPDRVETIEGDVMLIR